VGRAGRRQQTAIAVLAGGCPHRRAPDCVALGRGKHKQWLYLFTTTKVAGRGGSGPVWPRWQIETDLRSLKQTVRLQRVCARSEDMMEKELLVAVMAYNLVRAIMFQAAQRAQIIRGS